MIGALEDGSSVLFTTAERLLPAVDLDVSGVDIYERRSDGSLHLVSGGASTPTYLGENADGSVVFRSDDKLTLTDPDAFSDVYLRRRDGSLLLLTPGTPAAVIPNLPPNEPRIPSDQGRTVLDIAEAIPGTGDADLVLDAYEVTSNGLRLLAKSSGQTSSTSAQTLDGSRILFITADSLLPADVGGFDDVYESDFARPTVVGVPTLTGTGKFGGTLICKPPAFTGEGVTMFISWLREATVISTSTVTTYKTTLADAGHTLRCRAIARNGISAPSALSPTTIRIAPGARAKAITGFPIIGTRLSCTDFAGATRTTYVWKRGARAIAGKRTRSYKIVKADLGKRLTCAATGSNAGGATAVSLSRAVPRQCVVPNVRGLLPADARTKLGNAGCKSAIKRVKGSGVAKGRVLGTTPAPPLEAAERREDHDPRPQVDRPPGYRG